MEIYSFFDSFTIIVSVLLLIMARKKLMCSMSGVIYILFFLFYIFPLFIDYLYATPKYLNYRLIGFRISSQDTFTRCTYDIILIATQVFLTKYLFQLPVKTHKSTYTMPNQLLVTISICGMLLPIFITLLITRDPGYLYSYQWRELGYKLIPNNYSLIERSSYIGVSSCIIILFSPLRRTRILKTIAIACLFMAICAEGKRAIIFFALVNVSVLTFYRYLINSDSNIRPSKLLFIVLISLLTINVMIEMSFSVKLGRGYNDELSELVETTRIDFLRDDRVRMAIYSEIHPDKLKTLDYYGQTIINNFTHIFPIDVFISIFGGKTEETYQFYTTKAVSNKPINKDSAFMTPSIFAELVSNFGIILGSICFIFLNCWFMKISMRFPYPVNFFIAMSYCLINLFSFSYIIIYLEFTFFFCIFSRGKRKSKTIAKYQVS